MALRVSVCSNFFLSHSNGGVSSGFESNGSELLPSLSTYEQGWRVSWAIWALLALSVNRVGSKMSSRYLPVNEILYTKGLVAAWPRGKLLKMGSFRNEIEMGIHIEIKARPRHEVGWENIWHEALQNVICSPVGFGGGVHGRTAGPCDRWPSLRGNHVSRKPACHEWASQSTVCGLAASTEGCLLGSQGHRVPKTLFTELRGSPRKGRKSCMWSGINTRDKELQVNNQN